ncbi:MAG: winged helix DNA-binding domain-containing protein [Candidatus Dormibacteria bacterium]
MPDAAHDLLRGARMQSQRLSDEARCGGDPLAVLSAVTAVQAQSFDAARASLRVRSNGLTVIAVNRALDHDRSIVWTWLMRGTLHFVSAEDVRWLLALYGPRNIARDRGRRAQVGLDDATCERALRVIRRVLAHGPLTRPQLRDGLLRGGIDVSRHPQTLIHLVAHAAHRGVIVVLPPVGRDNRFALLDDWLGGRVGARVDDPEAELARRYFRAYAPATETDFAAWSGLPMANVRRAMRAIGEELQESSLGAGRLFELRAPRRRARSSSPAPEPLVRLLPYFDTYLLGYRPRDQMIDPAYMKRVIDGGWLRPTVCVDGWIEGAWRLRRERREALLDVDPFGELSDDVRRGIDREVTAIGMFLERPVSLGTADTLVRSTPT